MTHLDVEIAAFMAITWRNQLKVPNKKAPEHSSRAFIKIWLKTAKLSYKSVINYQFALFLWLFCSKALASSHAAEIRVKKSRIAYKGLKLKLLLCVKPTEFECDI